MKITRKQAKSILDATFPDYTGRKITLYFTNGVIFHNTNWFEGTCNKYAAIRSDGKVAKLNVPAPWNNFVEGQQVHLPEDVMIVCRSFFGMSERIVIYANTVHAPKWLPGG